MRRLLLLGTGGIAGQHVSEFGAVEGCRIVACADAPKPAPLLVMEDIPAAPQPAPRRADAPNFDPRYRFETFVVGKANEVAATAARTLASAGSVVFNPLFLHGGTGRGKTHLLHAIGQDFLERPPVTLRDREIQAEAYPELTGRRYEGALDRVLEGVRKVADEQDIVFSEEAGLENVISDLEDLAVKPDDTSGESAITVVPVQ